MKIGEEQKPLLEICKRDRSDWRRLASNSGLLTVLLILSQMEKNRFDL